MQGAWSGQIEQVRRVVVRAMRPWFESLLWCVYPAYCRCCHEPLGLSRVPYLCDPCWAALRWIDTPYCACCGTPLAAEAPQSARCDMCRSESPPLRRRSLVKYHGAMREAIHLLKYERRLVLMRHFDRMIEQRATSIRELGDFDVLVPVPLHPSRYRTRGFNQAELLARSVSCHTGIPIVHRAVIRIRATKPQSSLSSAEQRRQNISQAFAVPDADHVQGRRLLLIDDIYTTGATIREIAMTLHQVGAAEVGAFTLARA